MCTRKIVWSVQGQFRFEGPIFPTVKELIDDYVSTKMPITGRSGAVIKKPVKRENWELNNDDVKLIEKIGRVMNMGQYEIL